VPGSEKTRRREDARKTGTPVHALVEKLWPKMLSGDEWQEVFSTGAKTHWDGAVRRQPWCRQSSFIAAAFLARQFVQGIRNLQTATTNCCRTCEHSIATIADFAIEIASHAKRLAPARSNGFSPDW